MTGDLWIVGNNELRKFFTKNPKLRETNNTSREKTKFTIFVGLNYCIDTWQSKYGIDKSVLMEWKGKVIDNVDEKIKCLSNKTSSELNIPNYIYNQFVGTTNR